MADRYVREVGALDPDNTLTIGVDYGNVVVFGYELTRIQAAELGRLLVLACWQAAQNEQMESDKAAMRAAIRAEERERLLSSLPKSLGSSIGTLVTDALGDSP